jgi:hypothetical protein
MREACMFARLEEATDQHGGGEGGDFGTQRKGYGAARRSDSKAFTCRGQRTSSFGLTGSCVRRGSDAKREAWDDW